MTTDPFAQYLNDAFTSIQDIYGQHRLYLGTGYTFTEVTPRVLIHFMGLTPLQDPTPRQPSPRSRYMYKVVIPRDTLDAALGRVNLDLQVLDKSDDEKETPWAIQEAGDELIRPVRVHDLIAWEQDNPILQMRRLWRDEKGAPKWLELGLANAS